MGFRGMDKHTGVPVNTLSQRVIQNEDGKYLELPSDNLFRVFQIKGEDNNDYLLIEAADWVNLARDWAIKPGRLRTKARNGLINFLAWFAAEGLYAQAYTFLKNVYTEDDRQTLYQWLVAREAGKPYRNDWSWTIKEKDARYAYWTNYVYKGLFGMDAAQMKAVWENPVSGSSRIARNYIPKEDGLAAVAYCEKMVTQLDFDDMNDAHDTAIALTLKKFKLTPPPAYL